MLLAKEECLWPVAMLQVHHEGKGLCGIYQKDIADTKHQQVQNLARQAGHPLLSMVEEV